MVSFASNTDAFFYEAYATILHGSRDKFDLGQRKDECDVDRGSEYFWQLRGV